MFVNLRIDSIVWQPSSSIYLISRLFPLCSSQRTSLSVWLNLCHCQFQFFPLFGIDNYSLLACIHCCQLTFFQFKLTVWSMCLSRWRSCNGCPVNPMSTSPSWAKRRTTSAIACQRFRHSPPGSADLAMSPSSSGHLLPRHRRVQRSISTNYESKYFFSLLLMPELPLELLFALCKCVYTFWE